MELKILTVLMDQDALARISHVLITLHLDNCNATLHWTAFNVNVEVIAIAKCCPLVMTIHSVTV